MQWQCAHAVQVQWQCMCMQVGGQSTLTREEYQAVVADLHREARLLAKYGGEAQEREEFHIRMLMVRV